MNIYAIIPARGGSKGVPGKNLRLLAGYPLIAYSIAAAKLSDRISRAIVSTDSQEIAEVSRRFGAETPFLRPAAFAGDSSGDAEFMRHVLDWFKENEITVPQYLAHLRPTTPFRNPRLVDAAIELIISKPEATSMRSAHPAPESPFKWFLRGPEGFFSGIIPHYSNDDLNKPRQSFPEVYVPDGYIDIINSRSFLSTGLLHGSKMLAFVSPTCHEVDAPEDFDYLEFEIKRHGSVLLNYLKTGFPL